MGDIACNQYLNLSNGQWSCMCHCKAFWDHVRSKDQNCLDDNTKHHVEILDCKHAHDTTPSCSAGWMFALTTEATNARNIYASSWVSCIKCYWIAQLLESDFGNKPAKTHTHTHASAAPHPPYFIASTSKPCCLAILNFRAFSSASPARFTAFDARPYKMLYCSMARRACVSASS